MEDWLRGSKGPVLCLCSRHWRPSLQPLASVPGLLGQQGLLGMYVSTRIQSSLESPLAPPGPQLLFLDALSYEERRNMVSTQTFRERSRAQTRLLCLLWPHPEACLPSHTVDLHLLCLLWESLLMLLTSGRHPYAQPIFSLGRAL